MNMMGDIPKYEGAPGGLERMGGMLGQKNPSSLEKNPSLLLSVIHHKLSAPHENDPHAPERGEM